MPNVEIDYATPAPKPRPLPVVVIILIVSALVLFGFGFFIFAEPTTQPTTAPVGGQVDRLPDAFWFTYAYDKVNPRRDWTRLNATTWEEDDGIKPVRFELVEMNADEKDPGVILVRLPGRDMQVFVPTLDNPDKRIGWRYPPGKEPKNAPPMGEGMKWYTLSEMRDAE